MPRSHSTSAYRGSRPENPYVFTKKTVWMQRCIDLIRAGAGLYIQGSTRLEKVPFLLQKFASRYPVNLAVLEDRRARKAKRTVTRWIGYLDSSGMVNWALFCWPGQDFDPAADRWRDPIKDRVSHSGYEIVRITKPGAKSPVLTWRYQRDHFNQLHDQIVQVIRLRHDTILKQIIHELHRSPGFAGVRIQVVKLWHITRAEWKRTRSKNEEMPALPGRIGYVRRLPDVGMLWSDLMKEQRKTDEEKPVATRGRKARRDSILVPAEAGGQAEKDRG